MEQSNMKTKTTNPHAWFFAYVNNLEGYNKEFAKVIRSGIILEYTDGLTDSLSDLYKNHPSNYIQMKRALVAESLPRIRVGDFQFNDLDASRKRLIAVLFSFLSWKGTKPSMKYVKAIAANAAQVDHFNNIPLKKLKSLYRIFGEKKNKEANEWVDQVLNNAAMCQYEN
jgi:hypothetical protein